MILSQTEISGELSQRPYVSSEGLIIARWVCDVPYKENQNVAHVQFAVNMATI